MLSGGVFFRMCFSHIKIEYVEIAALFVGKPLFTYFNPRSFGDSMLITQLVQMFSPAQNSVN
jgi:hypothetical protein